jgi:hypothetical protein
MSFLREDENENKSRLSDLDRMYGYEDPAEGEEQEEGKTFAQKIADTLKIQREKALGKSRFI